MNLRISTWLSLLLGALLLAPLLGCKKTEAATDHSAEAHQALPIGHAECAACGMVVGEQPAPRVQVIHRDGSRAYLCSVADSLRYLEDKNAHGGPVATFVEVLPPESDPLVTNSAEQRWVEAAKASFVTGVPRKGVMGAPVVAYSDLTVAEKVAAQGGSNDERHVHSWKTLQAAPDL